jgi:hypothetical protein
LYISFAYVAFLRDFAEVEHDAFVFGLEEGTGFVDEAVKTRGPDVGAVGVVVHLRSESDVVYVCMTAR